MSCTHPSITGPQAIETAEHLSSKKRAEKSAADFSAAFHGRVIRTFAECLNIKQTAREAKIPARVVSEILHARDFVRMPPTPTAVGRGFTMRRVA